MKRIRRYKANAKCSINTIITRKRRLFTLLIFIALGSTISGLTAIRKATAQLAQHKNSEIIQNSLSQPSAAEGTEMSAVFGPPEVTDIYGDSWTAAWCDDDEQYLLSDDSKNVDGSCVNPVNGKGYNVTFGKLNSSSPFDPVSGTALSCMEDYGMENETISSPTSSNSCKATWKGIGTVCIGNSLYMGISRHIYAWNSFGNGGNNYCYTDHQKAFDGSIIRSVDNGQNWGPYPGLDASSSRVQFPGFTFGTPSFIQYGKGMNEWLADDAESYVYSVSNDGFWNGGSELFLARASRSTDLLDRSSWEYLISASPPTWGPLAVSMNPNSGFEVLNGSDPEGWALYGAAASVMSSPAAGNQTHGGGRAVQVFSNSDGAYQTVTGLSPGTRYYLTGYLRVSDSSQQVGIGVKNYGGTELTAVASSAAWSRKTVSFIPSGTSADIYCLKWAGEEGAGLCDDVEVTQEAPPEPILEAPGQVSVTQIQYIPASNGAPGLYLLPQWYYPDPNVICTSRWAFYMASAPWGPWTKISLGSDGPDGKEKEWSDCEGRTKGFYNPTVVPKWIGDYNPSTGERNITLLFAGDFGSLAGYKLHRIQMTLRYGTPSPSACTPNADTLYNVVNHRSQKSLDSLGMSFQQAAPRQDS